mgnify:CR=1 FL=1
MPLDRAQKRQLVTDALRDHFPLEKVDTPDTRTLQDLRKLFEYRHLGQLVYSYRKAQAERVLEDLDLADIDKL